VETTPGFLLPVAGVELPLLKKILLLKVLWQSRSHKNKIGEEKCRMEPMAATGAPFCSLASQALFWLEDMLWRRP
jgi:hypothetical protein